MNLTIHRNTREINGSCVEVSTARTKIIIDFGMPFVDQAQASFEHKVLAGKSAAELKELKILPSIKGLYAGEAREVDAVLLSHAHLDHYGLLKFVNPDIPIYMSRGAQELINVSNIFTSHKNNGVNARIIKPGRAFKIGDSAVTPFLVDHSAFDALAFLIEAEGKSIFYSGDLRAYGRTSNLFRRMVEHPPEHIDCLLMEGPMPGREKQTYVDEYAVQKRMEEILRSAETITFLFVPSQNITRIVSAYKACLKTNTVFVIDIYTAYVLDRLRKVSAHIPQFHGRNMRIQFYRDQADTLAEKVSQKLLYFYHTKKIDKFEINRRKHKILMLARDTSTFPGMVRNIEDPAGAKIIYSMWGGYLTEQFKAYCAQRGMFIEQIPVSGYATAEDLKTFAAALNPKIVVPVHTFEAKTYPHIFNNVKIMGDNEVLTV